MSFAALSHLSSLPVVTARLDSAIADPSTAANTDALLTDIFIVTNLYESIKPQSQDADIALENIGGFSCNLSCQLNTVSFIDIPEFVLSQIHELKQLCQHAERELSHPPRHKLGQLLQQAIGQVYQLERDHEAKLITLDVMRECALHLLEIHNHAKDTQQPIDPEQIYLLAVDMLEQLEPAQEVTA